LLTHARQLFDMAFATKKSYSVSNGFYEYVG